MGAILLWIQHKHISQQKPSLNMAYKNTFTFLTLLLISNILLTTVSGRHIHRKSRTQDKKEPEFLFHSGGHDYIPGIGHVGLPPSFIPPPYPYTGGGSGAGSGPAGHSYVPGGDDTFVPNPGYEVPIPGSSGGGRVPPAVLP